jgi:hypothetical protein
MIVAGGVVGTNFELGAEFGGGGFEIALTKVNEVSADSSTEPSDDLEESLVLPL